MTIWYILCSFGTFFPFWHHETKKNLATLVSMCPKLKDGKLSKKFSTEMESCKIDPRSEAMLATALKANVTKPPNFFRRKLDVVVVLVVGYQGDQMIL
jgi:hypothetical protein